MSACLPAHNIKNFKSQRWQTLLNFRTHRRLLLTGTPLQNSCLANGTRVALADGSLAAVETLQVGDRLVGEDGEVVRVTSSEPGSGKRMLEIALGGDLGSYVVTDDHLVTVQWSAPTVQCRFSDAVAGATERTVQATWFRADTFAAVTYSWDGLVGTEAQVEAQVLALVRAGEVSGEEGALPIELGDIVEVQASELQRLTSLSPSYIGVHSPRMRAVRTAMPAASITSSELPAAKVALEEGTMQSALDGTSVAAFGDTIKAAKAAAGDRQQVCDEYAQIALGDGKYRSVQCSDSARVVYMLHHPRQNRSILSHSSLEGTKSFAIEQLERAWDVLKIDVQASSGVVVTELNPIEAQATGDMNAQYDARCLLSMLGALASGAEVIVMLGDLAKERWSQLKAAGVTIVGENADGLLVEFPRDQETRQQVRVCCAPKPSAWRQFQPLLKAVSMAHTSVSGESIPIPSVAPSADWHGADILSIRDAPRQAFTILTVDGNHRYALANGTLTHSQ